MARGFESKDVEYQQAEQERARQSRAAAAAPLTPEQRAASERRATILLSLSRARADLEAAKTFAHRRMLEQAIGALERELASLHAD